MFSLLVALARFQVPRVNVCRPLFWLVGILIAFLYFRVLAHILMFSGTTMMCFLFWAPGTE